MPPRKPVGIVLLPLVAVLHCFVGPVALAHVKAPAAPPAAAAPTSIQEVEIWGCPMCETVRQPGPGTCSLCRMELVRLDPRAQAARPRAGASVETSNPMAEQLAAPAPRPLMPGLPDGVFYAAALSILALSFALLQAGGGRQAPRRARWDLFRIPGLKRLVRQRWFQFALQLPMVLLLALVVLAGLLGNPAPERNIAPILTWTVWWTWLVLAILLVGKLWCTACPWMAIADWISRSSLWRRVARPLGLGLRWPRSLRNIWLAIGLFVGLTWLELGYGVTQQPWLTAVLGLLMLVAAVGTLLVFERKAFCRYACLVGRVSGLYAMFAGTELRAADPEVCRTCRTKDCYRGNDDGYPCPTGQFVAAMETNTYCTLCLECVKSCPHDNLAWNARPPGSDLLEPHRVRVDEGYLAVILLSMSAFHGLTMTPAWDRFTVWLGGLTGMGQLGTFTLGMAGVLALPLVVYYGVCLLMKWFARDRRRPVMQLFVAFAYALLPIALFYHLAHNLQHILYEGKKLIAVSSDPFGQGLDLFGTARMPIDAVLPAEVIWGLQVALILAGHIYGIVIAHRVASTLYPDRRAAALSQVPMLAAMLLFSLQSLWLVAQPMVMRSAM